MTGAERLWGIAVIGVLALLPIQAHSERDEDGAVSVRADASDPLGTIFPSDLFAAHDFGQLTHRRVALPKPDCTTNPNDCFDIDVLNELDGFSLQPRITIPFTGAIDPATVTSETVFLVCLGDTGNGQGLGERVGINQVVFDVDSQTLAVQSDELLRQHARYLLVVTNGIRDVHGRRIRADAFDSLLERPASADAQTAAHMHELRPVLAGMQRHTRGRVVAASTPAQVDFMIGSARGQPVRTVFPVNTLRAVVVKTQTGTAPTFDPPLSIALSILDAVPGAVGQLVYRHDLAFAADPTKPKNPHRFLTANQVASMRSISLAAQRQAVVFLASMGATTIDPDDAGPLFEMPIRLPLPETLDFIP